MIDGLASAFGFGSAFGKKALVGALGPAPLEVAALSDRIVTALNQAGHTARRAGVDDNRFDLPDASVDAICLSRVPDAAIPALLADAARVVRPGGRILLATAAGITRRGPERHLVAAWFLHGGLVDLTQRLERGTLVTSGRVR